MASLFNMHSQQRVLFWINVTGGLAVILSYVQGIFVRHATEALWGGISGELRSVYIVSMVLAALSYFAFTYFILFRLNPETDRIFRVMKYVVFSFIYCFILIPSALWMPLTVKWMELPRIILPGMRDPMSGFFIIIHIILLIVGLAAFCLMLALLSLSRRSNGAAYWLAIIGSIIFCFHTLVLDGIVWPAFLRLNII